jgi:Tfp pilus assembly protein PilW
MSKYRPFDFGALIALVVLVAIVIGFFWAVRAGYITAQDIFDFMEAFDDD